MREEIKRLLDTASNIALRDGLVRLAQQDKAAFLSEAALWVPAVLQRDTNYFASLIIPYVPRFDQALVESVLPLVDPLKIPGLYHLLYSKIATPNRWNEDILTLVHSDHSDEEVLRLLAAMVNSNLQKRGSTYWYRYSTYTVLFSDVALALYQRNPSLFNGFIITYISEKPEDLQKLRGQIHELNDLSLYLFRRTATREEWHNILNRILELQTVDNISQVLEAYHPDTKYPMEREIYFSLIETFGEAILPYLERWSLEFARAKLETIFTTARSNSDLLAMMNDFRSSHTASNALKETADRWAPELHQRDPHLFENFIFFGLHSAPKKVIQNLLPQVRTVGQHRLYRRLYWLINNNDTWNADILRWVSSELTDAEVQRELDWIDLEEKNILLRDDIAVALYRRNPIVFRDFISKHLQFQSGQLYPQLRATIERTDQDFYWQIFRQFANNSLWQAEMEALLAADIPADRIVDELEKRHPANPQQVSPKILARFAHKYGIAVLPYFQQHVKFLTRKRLQQLFDLDLERGELRRELETLAQENPVEFTDMIDIWLPRLIQPDSEFFDKFILRYGATWMTFQNHADIIHLLLPWMEQAGKDRLFREFYRLSLVSQAEWEMEVRQIANNADLSDEQMLAALERRGTQMHLPIEVAMTLYKRNPDVFRSYLIKFLWNNTPLASQLLPLAQEQQDDIMIRALRAKTENSSPVWSQQIDELLEQDLTTEEVKQRLVGLQPRYTHSTRETDAFISLVEKYGEPLFDHLFNNLYWITWYPEAKQRVLDYLHSLDNQSHYWRAFLLLADTEHWNNAVRELLAQGLPEAEFFARFTHSFLPAPDTSPRYRYHSWAAKEDVLIAIYKLNPARALPIIESLMTVPSIHLFNQAQAVGDDELLDFLTYLVMHLENNYGHNRDLELISEKAVARLNRLYTVSTTQYVHHAANIIRRIPAYGLWRVNHSLQMPLFQLLFTQYRDAWVESPQGIRDLLESPNIYVQLMAIDMLNHPGDATAQRVIENLRALRALLLHARIKINTRTKVLQALEQAAQQHPDYARQILPVLEQTVDFRGKRAIPQKILVTYVRLERMLKEATV